MADVRGVACGGLARGEARYRALHPAPEPEASADGRLPGEYYPGEFARDRGPSFVDELCSDGDERSRQIARLRYAQYVARDRAGRI